MVEEGAATAEEIDKATRFGLGLRFAALGVVEFIDFGGPDNGGIVFALLFAFLTFIGFEATARIDRHDFGVSWQDEIAGGGVVAGNEIDIDIDIGVVVPRTVRYYPLPPRIIEIVPEFEGYVYFVLVDGRIVIVHPDTYVIVYIIIV